MGTHMEAGNVLVIEDDEDTGEMIAAILASAGYGVRVAKSRDAAIVAFETYLYEFVVMDYCMPGMAPEEFLSKVAHRGPYVVLVSALKNAEAEAERLGVDAWLHKPFDPTLLVDVIRTKRSRSARRRNGQ
jgi:DNA-binding response OmpR family regulator